MQSSGQAQRQRLLVVWALSAWAYRASGVMSSTEPMRPRGEFTRYWDRHWRKMIDPTRTARGRLKSITRRRQRNLARDAAVAVIDGQLDLVRKDGELFEGDADMLLDARISLAPPEPKAGDRVVAYGSEWTVLRVADVPAPLARFYCKEGHPPKWGGRTSWFCDDEIATLDSRP